MKPLFVAITILVTLVCCTPENNGKLFTRLDQGSTGIDFRNLIKEDNPEFNVVIYPYYYNGAGVGAGDINNDGLTDLVFTGNMVKNRLFLNKGGLKFEDITASSHIAEKEGWCTGVTMADINQDGWLDIYICRSAFANRNLRKNLLFINNKDLTFTESAAAYGLDDAGYSTQASFFDYDLDGDLDMFLINQSDPAYSKGKIEFVQLRNRRGDTTLENKLYRNDGNVFTNITAGSGIRSSVLTFSLGVSTTDINQDGWPDIYVANDFKEPDYFYINDRNGKFIDSLVYKLDNTSLYSMGCDVADYNNDLLPDLVVLDMLPENNYAQKMHMGNDNYNQYNYLFGNGMFYQYMKNTLQRNNGDGTFSEVAQLAGISNTDWSWSPLMADFDNDGHRDIFITNGYKRDNTDIQFIVYSMDQSLRMQKGAAAATVSEYIAQMPGIHIPNYLFRNEGDDKFSDKAAEWGMGQPSFSHGAIYADLDNDGDLDIVTNDIDDYAGVYRNNTNERAGNNYIRIQLKGDSKNLAGIGTKIVVWAGSQRFYLEQQPVRGFQSSVDPVLHAGLGKLTTIDSLDVYWPDGSYQQLKGVEPNTLISIGKSSAIVKKEFSLPTVQPHFEEKKDLVPFSHMSPPVNDFNTQGLLPHYMSVNGPCMAKADVNNDGFEDVYIGGGPGQAGVLYLGKKDSFRATQMADFTNDAAYTDVSATFFDADRDGDADLYVASGGYNLQKNDPLFADRLYLNNGKGNFKRSHVALPAMNFNKNVIVAHDADGDGDEDLFVGGGAVPGNWPVAEKSALLLNDGKGKFVLSDQALDIHGIVHAASWVDVNNDKRKDLVIAGEWMPLQVFISSNGRLLPDTSFNPAASSGWFTSMAAGDLDGDGDEDLVLGNYGLNSQLKADGQHPMELYYGDFDGNGSVDPIFTTFIKDGSYPFVVMEDLNGQVPMMKKKFYDYQAYARATTEEVVGNIPADKKKMKSIQTLQTVVFENTGKKFIAHALPVDAQYAPVYTILISDFDNDGKNDIVLAGNQLHNRIRLGRLASTHGLLMQNRGKFVFTPVRQSGLKLVGETRSLIMVNDHVLAGINNGRLLTYKPLK